MAEILSSRLVSIDVRPLVPSSQIAGRQEAVAEASVPIPTAAMTVSLVVASLTTRSCRGLQSMPHVCGFTQDTDGGPSNNRPSPPAARLWPGLHGLDGSQLTTNRGNRSVAET